LDVVVFSDFECNSCRRLAEFLDRKARPLFGGSLRIVYKHYPLNSDCNPRTVGRMHKHACDAARLAEAARIIGGNDGFWHAHDSIFSNQALLKKGQLTSETLAQPLGMDHRKLLDAANADSVEERIVADVALGMRCGVTSTPALFINEKRVETLAADSIGFWDALADLYWKNVKITRPESTRIPTDNHRDDSAAE